MLSRRHLRIRVMQALYAYYQSDPKDITRTELELLNGTKKIYELYLTILQFYLELAHEEHLYYSDTPASALTGERKTATRLLQDTTFIKWMQQSTAFNDLVKKAKISWQQDRDLVRKSFFHLRQTERYKEFNAQEGDSAEPESEYLGWIFKELFHGADFLKHMLEERTIYWAESLELAESMVMKTIESGKNGNFRLLPLYKDEEDDVKFMRDLVNKTIRDDAYYQEMIAEKTKNWDADRIALVDIILMKMALCEILHISSIPVKVSINEYIDISKDYSTPNSKSFINGVIDKLVGELREQGKITKTGRGLLE